MKNENTNSILMKNASLEQEFEFTEDDILARIVNIGVSEFNSNNPKALPVKKLQSILTDLAIFESLGPISEMVSWKCASDKNLHTISQLEFQSVIDRILPLVMFNYSSVKAKIWLVEQIIKMIRLTIQNRLPRHSSNLLIACLMFFVLRIELCPSIKIGSPFNLKQYVHMVRIIRSKIKD